MKKINQSYINSRSWLMRDEDFNTLNQFASEHNFFENLKLAEGSIDLLRNLSNDIISTNDGVAVVKLHGAITTHANLFNLLMGGTSLEQFKSKLISLANDDEIKKIVIDIDSGGGESSGIPEVSNLIREIGKPIIGVATGNVCSAAYWIGSACDKLYLSGNSLCGSIGTIISFVDDTEFLKKQGVEVVSLTSTQSPNKNIDLTSEDGKNHVVKTMLDPITELFIENVAESRGVTIDKVKSDFGRGGVFVGRDAVAIGMADGILSLDKITKKLNGENKMKEENENQDINAGVDIEKIKAEAIKGEQVRMSSILEICNDEEILAQARQNHEMTDKDVAFLMVKKEKENKVATSEAVQSLVEEDKEAISMASPKIREEKKKTKEIESQKSALTNAMAI